MGYLGRTLVAARRGDRPLRQRVLRQQVLLLLRRVVQVPQVRRAEPVVLVALQAQPVQLAVQVLQPGRRQQVLC